jgi:glycosyltransferase involved in cell wall biosynthesis
LGRKLIVVGKGKEEGYLKSLAGPSVTFLGYVPDSEIGPLFARCRAFLFAAVEDFGIAPVEAQSYGRPVIAYGYGGSLETVRGAFSDAGPATGVYFRSQTVEEVITAIEEFEAAETRFSPEEIQLHARRFDTSVFEENFRRHVEEVIRRHQAGR